MIWQIYVGISVLSFTALNIIQRKVAQDTDSPRASAIAFNCTAAFLSGILFFLTTDLQSLSLPQTGLGLLLVLAAVVCYGLFERGRFIAAKLLDASTFVTVLSSSIVISFIGSVIFLHETFTSFKAVGFILIFIALLLVSMEKSVFRASKKGLLIGFLVSLALGLGWTFDKKAIEFVSPNLYVVLVWTLPLLIIAFPKIELKEVKKEFADSGKSLLLMAGLNVVGYFSQVHALALADATIVLPLIQITTISTVLAGIFLLNEKESIAKKIIASVLSIVGAYFLL